jgi:hypothetical protein
MSAPMTNRVPALFAPQIFLTPFEAFGTSPEGACLGDTKGPRG